MNGEPQGGPCSEWALPARKAPGAAWPPGALPKGCYEEEKIEDVL